MQSRIKIDGELVDLVEGAADFIRQGMRAPLEKLGAALEDRMRAITPVGPTGDLAASISHKTFLFAQSGVVGAVVGPAKNMPGKPTNYAHLVEFGHKISGAVTRTGEVAPRPFVRPTAETARATAIDIIGPGAAQAMSVSMSRAKRRKIIKESI